MRPPGPFYLAVRLRCSSVVLLLLLLVVLGEGGRLLLVGGLELAQTLVPAREDVLLPDKDFVEFAVCNEDLVEAAQVFVVSVHDTEYPEAVLLDRLDRVVIQRQRLQVSKAIEFLGFLEVLDVVTM